MILMYGVVDRSIPQGAATYLAQATVSLYDQNISLLERKAIKFTVEKFDLVDVVKS